MPTSSYIPDFLKKSVSYIALVVCLYIIGSFNLLAQNSDVIFEKPVTILQKRTTVYDALNELSDSIGFLFAYDSRIIDSDKNIRLNIRSKPLKNALYFILGDSTFYFTVIEKHILIKKSQNEVLSSTDKNDSTSFIAVRGRVLDSLTRQPIAYATVGVMNKSIGNITNNDGVFMLNIPKKYNVDELHISHLGYKSKTIPANLYQFETFDIYLPRNYISIQEVIIRNVEPNILVKQAISNIPNNYSQEPMYLNAFYREGVYKNNKYINYSEAFFSIYKSSYTKEYDTDQVKVLKSRKTENIDKTDTLNIKLKGGVSSSLALDIIKNFPTFLQENATAYFTYSRIDIITIGNRTAYLIGFEQKEFIKEPLFIGEMYIDIETLAILGAKFEVNPKYISKTTNQFVFKRNRKFRLKPESITYSVRYNYLNNSYYLAHVRGDLKFKYRNRRSIFYNQFHTFLELATVQIDTLNVTRFSRKDQEVTSVIFVDKNFEYDNYFWESFNYISPEESVFDSFKHINAMIEEIKSK